MPGPAAPVKLGARRASSAEPVTKAIRLQLQKQDAFLVGIQEAGGPRDSRMADGFAVFSAGAEKE
eukprot:8569442-Pyramimonas_sp.AAC.1